MTHEELLDIVRRCDLRRGEELVPGKAYLFNRKFKRQVEGENYYDQLEIIVLVKDEVKVGGILRMGTLDIHCVVKEKYRGQHILSDFCKTGIIGKIWPENTSTEICDVYTKEEYEKKKHIADLLNMTIKN